MSNYSPCNDCPRNPGISDDPDGVCSNCLYEITTKDNKRLRLNSEKVRAERDFLANEFAVYLYDDPAHRPDVPTSAEEILRGAIDAAPLSKFAKQPLRVLSEAVLKPGDFPSRPCMVSVNGVVCANPEDQEKVEALLDQCNRCGSEDDHGFRFHTGFFDEEEGWTCARCAFAELKGLRADARRFIEVLGREGYAKLCRFFVDKDGGDR